MTSGLTPSVSRLNLVEPDSSKLYSLVINHLENNLFASASHFAEQLYTITNSVSHGVLLAKCHYLANEKRRALGALEHFGYLGGDILHYLIRDSENESHQPQQQQQGEYLQAILLGSQCLFDLEQYEDCITLLGPLIGSDKFKLPSSSLSSSSYDLRNKIATLYFLMGKCYDMLDNRPRAIRNLLKAIQIDPCIVEAADYIVTHCLLTSQQKLELLVEIEEQLQVQNPWLLTYYNFLLNESATDIADENGSSHLGDNGVADSQRMVLQAERLYAQSCSEMACRIARKAYTLDPYNWRGLTIYIACLCDMEYKTELFYLGHELVDSHPKKPLTWYAVGCYYWCCKKLELAQKYFQRATKMDKKFAKAWLALGVVLSAQEETEHSLSAFRTACRLLPGLQIAMFFLAKELSRTSNHSLALQVLHGALEISDQDVMVLNELGVIYMNRQELGQALEYLMKAAHLVTSTSESFNSSCDYIILNNFGTCLRKSGKLKEALEWYHLSLSSRPGDASTHANIAFTYHLMRNFSSAIESYHRALSLQPTLLFCSDMLSKALEDSEDALLLSGGTKENMMDGGFENSFSVNRRHEQMMGGGESDSSSVSLGLFTPSSSTSLSQSKLYSSLMST